MKIIALFTFLLLACLNVSALRWKGDGGSRLGSSLLGLLPKNPFAISSTPKSDIERQKLKEAIRDVTKLTENGVKASGTKRLEIDSLVSELEKLNPSKQLTENKYLQGNWRLIYTTNDGSSAGKLGPFVGVVDQDIDLLNKKYVNYVKLGPNVVEGALTATWENVDKSNWKVKFENITLKLFGFVLTKKSLIGSVGNWRMSYLDDTMRILYAKGGKNALKENIYILVK